MRYVLAVAVACLIAVSALPAYSQDAPKQDAKPSTADVNGVWDMVVEAPQGAIDVVTTFKQEGEKITGTQASPMGEIAFEGTVVGNEIKWILNLDMGGQQVAIAFAGKVDGESMAGVFEMGGMGTAAWSAKKRK